MKTIYDVNSPISRPSSMERNNENEINTTEKI